jgi:hypothetical protein
MKLHATLVGLVLAAAACGETPAPGTNASGSPASTQGGAPGSARPSMPPPRPTEAQRKEPRRLTEPSVMKAFHAERCHLGLVTAGLAKGAYEKSLGKDRPGPKVPDLGVAPDEKGANPASVYVRLVRACNVAGAADKPPHPELDKALDAAVEVGPPLGTALQEAGEYYGKKEQEKDSFEKGREVHGKLKKGFEKLDAVTKEVGDALALYNKAFPPKLEAAPAQKSRLSVERAKAAYLLLLEGKDKAAIEKAIGEVEAAVGELDAATKDLKGDAYAAYVPKAARSFIEKAKAAAGDSATPNLVAAGWALGNLLEAENNAYKRDVAGIVEPEPAANPHHGMQ